MLVACLFACSVGQVKAELPERGASITDVYVDVDDNRTIAEEMIGFGFCIAIEYHAVLLHCSGYLAHAEEDW